VSHAINLKPRRQRGFSLWGARRNSRARRMFLNGMWNQLNTHHAVQLLRSEACAFAKLRRVHACSSLSNGIAAFSGGGAERFLSRTYLKIARRSRSAINVG
jgi:hypothetical protein